jgi:predicted ATPase
MPRGRRQAALGVIDEAPALVGETGEHWFDAGLHRIRGEILIKQNPADSAHAEASFLAAIAVARQQKARSFGLRAALSLAKLYHSTGHPIDAHAAGAGAARLFADAGVSADRRDDTVRGREQSDRRSIMTRATTVGT